MDWYLLSVLEIFHPLSLYLALLHSLLSLLQHLRFRISSAFLICAPVNLPSYCLCLSASMVIVCLFALCVLVSSAVKPAYTVNLH